MTNDQRPAARDRSDARPRAGGKPPVDEATRRAVLARHGAGAGRNAIARELGLGGATVSGIVTAAGLTFDRAATRAATSAAKADAAATRTEESSAALDMVRHCRRLSVATSEPGDLAAVARAARDWSTVHERLARIDEARDHTAVDDWLRSLLGDVPVIDDPIAGATP